ncbi:MAG: YceD family protein [Thermoanaerobaculia bacterium]
MRDIISFDEIDEHGPQTYRGEYPISSSELDREELTGLGPVKVEASAEQGGLPGEYVVEGTAQFTADFLCSRCVDPYPIVTNSAFHVRFRPRPEVSEEDEEVEITAADELDVEFYSDRQVPLRDLAIEQIQLAIPMKPLCNENCLGLCPTCGSNRNREKCSCDTKIVDERWGALEGIRASLSRKKDV